MAIIQLVTKTDFGDAFNQLRPDNFSCEGLGHLYDYLNQLAEDIGEPIELDVIALCCDYSEEPVSDVLENYNLDSVDELGASTTLVMHDHGLAPYYLDRMIKKFRRVPQPLSG